MSAINKKIVMLGDFGVGKTSLVRRYVLSEFSPDYQTTLGVNVYKFSDDVSAADGSTCRINLIIWDIEGGIGSDRLLNSYLIGAAGAVIVADITRDDAGKSLLDFADRFQAAVPGRPMGFAFNKTDLPHADGGKRGAGVVERFGIEPIRTSAATGEAVPDLFRSLSARILETGA